MENNSQITGESSGIFERPEKVKHSLPVIKLGNRQLRDISNDCWAAVLLLNEKNPVIFVKRGKLVRLRDRGDTLEIESFSLDEMVGLLTRKADWVYVNSSGESKSTKPDKDAIRDMLSCIDEKIPALESVMTTPLFNKNGKLLSKPGFHESDAIYLDPKRLLDVPPISQHPSSKEIADAISLLMTDTMGDFAFAGPSDKAHALGALLLPFVRELIPEPTPLHGIEAPVPGSAKTLFVKVVSCICSGQEAQTHTLPGDEAEMRKKITAELLRGPQLFIFDNIHSGQTISSGVLASVLTSLVWRDRLLNDSKTVGLRNRAVWFLTANNPALSTEISRRYVRVRLSPKVEKPWELPPSVFRHADLLSWIRRNRNYIVAAILTLIQAWISLGRPKPTSRTLGSFTLWSNVIGGILEVAGVKGFLENRDETHVYNDAEGESWNEFIRNWWDHYQSNPKSPGELNTFCQSFNLMTSFLGVSVSKRSQETILGKVLSSSVGRIFGGLELALYSHKSGHGKKYHLIPVPLVHKPCE